MCENRSEFLTVQAATPAVPHYTKVSTRWVHDGGEMEKGQGQGYGRATVLIGGCVGVVHVRHQLTQPNTPPTQIQYWTRMGRSRQILVIEQHDRCATEKESPCTVMRGRERGESNASDQCGPNLHSESLFGHPALGTTERECLRVCALCPPIRSVALKSRGGTWSVSRSLDRWGAHVVCGW